MRRQLALFLVLGLGCLALPLQPAESAPTPNQQCLTIKLRSAARFLRCMSEADIQSVLGNRPDYGHCQTHLERTWQRVEAKLGDACSQSHDPVREAALNSAQDIVEEAFGAPRCEPHLFNVQVSLDQALAGVVVLLQYPVSVSIPGMENSSSVRDRVAFTSTDLALTDVADLDEIGPDNIDDTLVLSYVSLDNQPAGVFATVSFDTCLRAHQKPPRLDDLSCVVSSAAVNNGTSVDNAHCSLSLAP